MDVFVLITNNYIYYTEHFVNIRKDLIFQNRNVNQVKTRDNNIRVNHRYSYIGKINDIAIPTNILLLNVKSK